MPPRRGDYYMCITVSEYLEGGYVITDNRNMSKVVTLAPAAPARVNLTGGWSWKRDIEAVTMSIQVKKITNNKASKSGSLRLAVWATKQPYNGGRINGFQLGSVDKKAIPIPTWSTPPSSKSPPQAPTTPPFSSWSSLVRNT